MILTQRGTPASRPFLACDRYAHLPKIQMSKLNEIELPNAGVLDRRWRKVWGPRQGKPVCGYALSNRPIICATHFFPEHKRTLPCRKKKGGCDKCDRGIGPRPMGYLAGCWKATLEPMVFELTEAATRALIETEIAKKGLRGALVTTFRKGDGSRAPVWVKAEPGLPGDVIPKDFDVEASLWRMWEGTNSTHEQIDELEKLIADSLPAEPLTPNGDLDL